MATNPKLEEIANMLMRNQTTSMIAPNEYTDRTRSGQANIDRRNKMIALLQGQANAPIERFGYGGIEAVTPPAAYLNKILSGVMAQYQSGKAGQEQEALDKYKEQAQTQDMAAIREAASMPGTSLNLRPGTQATDLTQMNENLLPGMDPFTGSIRARRNTTTTPGGSQAMFDLTQADRKAVEDTRREELTRQFETQGKLDLEARTVQNKIDADKLRNDERIAAAALANKNTIENQIADEKRQRDKERAEYGLPPEGSIGGTSTPSAGTPTSPPMTLAEAKTQKALDQKQRENTQTQLFDAQKALPTLEKNAKDLFNVINKIAIFDENGKAVKKHPGFDAVVGSTTGLVTKHIPGTKAADFKTLMDQLGGKAFLEAYASLRGAGAIANIESEKATQAVAALSTSQSPEAFLQNLRDFKLSVQESIDAARKKAIENPPSLDDLEEGVKTNFNNGQAWTLKNGKAVRIN